MDWVALQNSCCLYPHQWREVPLLCSLPGQQTGCPLSHLLFAMAIEPLAIWLRGEERFEGITRMGVTHKLSLYVDDLLLYVSNPVSSLPVVKDILMQFGKYSGPKLNFHKSELLPINALAKKITKSLFSFRVVSEGFRYLEVFITTSFDDVFAKNFCPLVDKCKLDITRWSSLPLSLIGCINLIKMVILPKSLYLFQHIPVFIRWCHRFYGLIKPHALRKPFYNSPKVGGMALPNFIQYYWACNIGKLRF